MARGSAPGERRGGRQKGTPNRRTAEKRQELQTYIEGQVLEAHRADYDPVEAINAITRWAQEQWRIACENNELANAIQWADRINEWGGKAAPYIRPRLNAVEARVNVNLTVVERIERGRQRLALAA